MTPRPTHSHLPTCPPPQVTFKRKRHYLGMHACEEEAAKAYDQGAICLLVSALARPGLGVDSAQPAGPL